MRSHSLRSVPLQLTAGDGTDPTLTLDMVANSSFEPLPHRLLFVLLLASLQLLSQFRRLA